MVIDRIRRHKVVPSNANRRDAAARAHLVRMTPGKWRLVRVCDMVVRFFLPLIPTLRAIGGEDAQPNHMLVIEYWNLGDLAILVPFLRNLRRSFPKARISLLVKRGLESFLKDQGIVDEFIPVRVPWAQHSSHWRKYNPFSRHWISLVRAVIALRRHRFDWAFSGRMDVRDNFLLWLSGARRRIGYGFAGGGSFLTDRVTPDLSRPHRADIWLRLLEAVGKASDSELRGFKLGDSELVSARSFLRERGIPPGTFLVGIHPGARNANRRWGCEHFAEVAQRALEETDAHVLWFSEPGEDFEAPASGRCHAVSLGFRPFLAVLSRCQLLVCNDSGPMHLANLLGVPVVAIFGPTNPVWFGPRGLQDQTVIRPEVWCRPCFDHCIFDQPYCLQTISVEEVCAAVRTFARSAVTSSSEQVEVSKCAESDFCETNSCNE